jgi:hypothetical protein
MVFYAVGMMNLLGNTIEKNTETLIYASKFVGLEINTEKTKYMSLSRYQIAEQDRDIREDRK